jgi:hypothetical protein
VLRLVGDYDNLPTAGGCGERVVEKEEQALLGEQTDEKGVIGLVIPDANAMHRQPARDERTERDARLVHEPRSDLNRRQCLEDPACPAPLELPQGRRDRERKAHPLVSDRPERRNAHHEPVDRARGSSVAQDHQRSLLPEPSARHIRVCGGCGDLNVEARQLRHALSRAERGDVERTLQRRKM